jgi:hypothetical protein
VPPALVAKVRERWPLAGDQLYVDLNARVVQPGTVRAGDVVRKL